MHPPPPQVILFTNKDEAPGVYKALAMSMRKRADGQIGFLWVHAGASNSKGVMEQFRPPKVPHLTLAIYAG